MSNYEYRATLLPRIMIPGTEVFLGLGFHTCRGLCAKQLTFWRVTSIPSSLPSFFPFSVPSPLTNVIRITNLRQLGAVKVVFGHRTSGLCHIKTNFSVLLAEPPRFEVSDRSNLRASAVAELNCLAGRSTADLNQYSARWRPLQRTSMFYLLLMIYEPT